MLTIPNTIGGRYTIQELIGRGGMGAVYRAVDRLTGKLVALKQIALPLPQPSESPTIPAFLSEWSRTFNNPDLLNSNHFRLALAQEYKTLASLRHPHIVSVLDYGFDAQQQSYFTMELLENAPNILEAGCDRPLAEQLEMLVQMIQALAYSHRRGVIHRDLKPDNVLFVDGQMKVLDFGLAIVHGHLPDEQSGVAGTIAYMAPEVLQGEPASKASDWFAVGVIAHELLLGCHPFMAEERHQLLENIIHVHPNIWEAELDYRLAELLDRLLDKDPKARLTDVDEVLRICTEVAERPELRQETAAVRESYLQAADFVGRERELGQLVEALQAATKQQGSAWLISGESGVGKSRLIEELRTQALVDGALVLRSQAVSAGGAPYQIWRPILRRLALSVDLSDYEAGVLKPLVPDIANLLGRPIPNVQSLDDPQLNRGRLLQVIEGMLANHEQPLVVILEDVHWAGNESIILLKRIASAIKDGYVTSLLLLASYRNDERLDFAADIPTMRRLQLGRLDREHVAALAESMLGATGESSVLVDWLTQETEGNAFFIVEVMRVLAEEAGELRRVGNMVLPSNVFAGGIRAVVDRRLNGVPRQSRPLLCVAAIAGRQLDLRVLEFVVHQHYPRIAKMGVDSWLNGCARAAVLDIQDQEWRFAHDKLRDGLLVNLPLDVRSEMHQQVAEAIEQIYPDDSARAASLAYHWSQANDIAKEAHYTVIVGEQALFNGAYQDAIGYLERAQYLYNQIDVSDLKLATLARQLGGAYFGLGHFTASGNYIERALALMGEPLPQTGWQLLRQLDREIGRQIWNRLGWSKSNHSPNAAAQEMSRIYLQLTWVKFFTNDLASIFYTTLRGFNLTEHGRASSERARLAIWATIIASFTRLSFLSNLYTKIADQTISESNDLSAFGQQMYVNATGVLHSGSNWTRAERLLQQSLKTLDTPKDQRQWLQAATVNMEMSYLQGDFLQCLSKATHTADVAQKRGDLQTQVTALIYQAFVYLRLGYLEGANTLAQEIEDLVHPSIGCATEALAHSALSLIQAHNGHLNSAIRSVKEALTMLENREPIVPWTFEGLQGMMEVCLRAHAADTRAAGLHATCKAVIRLLKHISFYYQIFRPRVYLWRGIYAWQNGRRWLARWYWHLGLRQAQKFGLRYEEAFAYGLYAKYLWPDSENGKSYQTQADEIFTELGIVAPWPIEQS